MTHTIQTVEIEAGVAPAMNWLCCYKFDNIHHSKEINLYQTTDNDGDEVFHGVGVIEGVDVGNNVQFRDYYNLDELKAHCKDWLF